MSLINKSIKSAVKAAYRTTTGKGATALKAIELIAKDSEKNSKVKGSKSERAEKFANKWFDLHESEVKRSVSELVDLHLADEDITEASTNVKVSKKDFVVSELVGFTDELKSKLARKALKSARKDAKASKKGLKSSIANLI